MAEERERRGPMVSQSRHSERRDLPPTSGPEPQAADTVPSPIQSQPETPAIQQPAEADVASVVSTPPNEPEGQMRRPAETVPDQQKDQAQAARTQGLRMGVIENGSDDFSAEAG